MNDGTVENGQALRTGDSGVADAGFGGNVIVMTSTDANSGFYLNGGTIRGGSAPSGGNVRINNNAKMVMTGGTIQDAQTAHNVFVNITGSLTMSGGTIKNAPGVNVFVNGISTSWGYLTITKGTLIQDDSAGHNIDCAGILNLSGDETYVVGSRLNFATAAKDTVLTGGYISTLYGQPRANASGGYYTVQPGAGQLKSGATVTTLGTPVKKTIEGVEYTFGYQVTAD